MLYRGYYTYNEEKTPTEFTTKKVSDTLIYGEGKDNGGDYTIEGKISPSNFICLTKKYIGAHTVDLCGRVIKASGNIEKIRGVWELKNVCSGDFEYYLYSK